MNDNIIKAIKNKDLFNTKNFINGQWVNSLSNKTMEVINPATKQIIGKIPYCGKSETEKAVICAEKARLKWSNLTMQDRSVFLHKTADLMLENLTDLSIIMTFEHGKPLAETKGELMFAINLIKWFAEQGKRAFGDIIPSTHPNHRILITKEPIGVVGIISPWNFPAATPVRKAAAALISGCPVIIKPSELTPFSAFAIAYLFDLAGMPPGVVNVVTGDAPSIGEVLTKHPNVKLFSFTGSTGVGKLLQKQCADTLKKTSLELGGNSPLIVFDDADIDVAIQGTIDCKFRNTGQTCVCANRIFVQEGIYDDFLKKLISKVTLLKMGNGMDQGIILGPLINQQAVNKVNDLVENAVKFGANIIYKGTLSDDISKLGYYVPPIIITNLDDKMKIANEEIFGPVAAIYKFSSEDEVIKRANDTPYGLASYVFTQDLTRAIRMSEAIKAGVVSINEGVFTTEVAPFGGFKESGIGREGGKEGLEEFLEIKYVCLGNIK